jgi:hypothetical protein
MGRPFIPEGRGEAAMLADHRCPEDAAMDAFHREVIVP